jgi:hypothetical protein
MAGGRNLIAAPPRRVQTHTLFGVAAQPTAGTRWVNGVTWRSLLCGETGGVSLPQCGSYVVEDDPVKVPNAAFGAATYDPFVVWAAAVCSTFGDRDDVATSVRDALMIDRHRQLEYEFWTGTLAQEDGNDNPYLAKVDAVDELHDGDPTPVAYALADLQQAIADCAPGGRGIIHATVRTVSIWHLLGMIRVDGTALVDVHGNYVVPGVGYDGSAPGGAVDTTGATAWAYATGTVMAAFGTELDLPAVDRDVNSLHVVIEEMAGAWFDECCLTGVNVDLCNTECVTGS